MIILFFLFRPLCYYFQPATTSLMFLSFRQPARIDRSSDMPFFVFVEGPLLGVFIAAGGTVSLSPASFSMREYDAVSIRGGQTFAAGGP